MLYTAHVTNYRTGIISLEMYLPECLFAFLPLHILANVNYLLLPVRLSVICNVCAPYSGSSNFRQYFYDIRYPDHPLTSTENFTEIVPGEPLRRGS